MSPAGSVGGDGRLRLFLALRLPAAVLDALEQWGERELSGGRLLGRDHLHVTLAFLGSRPVADLPAVVDALRGAASGAPAFVLEPAAWRETRSVGMVVLCDRSGVAGRLAADLHGRLEALGVYRREARPWLPHVTVLRFRQRPRLCPPLPPVGPFAPSDAAAFLSRLHPTGATYEVLDSIELNSTELNSTGLGGWNR